MQHVATVNGVKVPERWAYLLGCEKCSHGRRYAKRDTGGYKNYPKAHNTYELMLAEWRDGLWTPCDCDAGPVAARSLEYAAAQLEEQYKTLSELVDGQAQRRLDRIFSDAHVPARFASLTFKSFVSLAGNDPGKAAAIKRIREYFDTGSCATPLGKRHGILLYGRSDMGKTGALCPLFMHHVRAGQPGLWVQYNDLLAALRDFESGQVQERIKAAQAAELLFIDDFGDPAADRAATDYTRDTMFRLLDHRNNYRLPTFITSNLHPDKMSGQFHERVVKRLGEMCAIVEVSGTPMRELMEDAEDNRRHSWTGGNGTSASFVDRRTGEVHEFA